MAKKALKSIMYDTIQRGTNDYVPITFLRQVEVDPATGDPLPESELVPFDLTGRVVMMTVKAKEYDGVNPVDNYNGKPAHDEPLRLKWREELQDKTTPNNDIDRDLQPTGGPWGEDYLFRIFIDCDDESEGRFGPRDDSYYWQNNYQGMYGMDPAEGKVVFRITKKMTMVKPGTYYFDIRLMEKMHKQIGMIEECRNWAPIFGELEIQGTPTNRAAMFDWIEPEESI